MSDYECNNYFSQLCKKIPPYVGGEIFKFIIPDFKRIIFITPKNVHKSYNNQYQVAFIGYEVVENQELRTKIKSKVYLSRIPKNNGKHRYYIATEKFRSFCYCCGKEDCFSIYCRGGFCYDYKYESRYVGKDIHKALIELFLCEK